MSTTISLTQKHPPLFHFVKSPLPFLFSSRRPGYFHDESIWRWRVQLTKQKNKHNSCYNVCRNNNLPPLLIFGCTMSEAPISQQQLNPSEYFFCNSLFERWWCALSTFLDCRVTWQCVDWIYSYFFTWRNKENPSRNNGNLPACPKKRSKWEKTMSMERKKLHVAVSIFRELFQYFTVVILFNWPLNNFMRLQPKKTRVLLEFFSFPKEFDYFYFPSPFSIVVENFYIVNPGRCLSVEKLHIWCHFFMTWLLNSIPFSLSPFLLPQCGNIFFYLVFFKTRWCTCSVPVDRQEFGPDPWTFFFTTTSFLVFRNYRYFYPSASPKGQLQSASMW